MNTIEGNKLIAEFMGGKFIKSDPMFFNGNSSFYYFKTEGKSANNLQYHSSWDWLMPVVEKINNLKKETKGVGSYQWNLGNHADEVWAALASIAGINPVWQAAIQFIEWYNKEQSVEVSDTTEA